LPIRVVGKSTHFEKLDFSFIPFGPIMRLAKHFAVGTFGGTALTPSSHVVGIHFSKFPNFILVHIVGYDIVRAVGKFIFWGQFIERVADGSTGSPTFTPP